MLSRNGRKSASQLESAAKVAGGSQKVALAAPVPNVSFADDAKVIRNGALTLVVESPTTAVAGDGTDHCRHSRSIRRHG